MRISICFVIIGFVRVCVRTDLVMSAATNCLPHGCGDGVVDCAGELARGVVLGLVL